MTFAATYRLEDIDAAKRAFIELDRRMVDLTPLADAIGQTLVESAAQRLAVTNMDPDGKPWPDSARTRAKGGRIQYDRGTAGLAGSLTHAVENGGRSVAYGSALPYAAQRQFGGTIKPRDPSGFLVFETLNDAGQTVKIFARSVTQPARPYLGVSDDDAEEISALALDYIDQALDGARP